LVSGAARPDLGDAPQPHRACAVGDRARLQQLVNGGQPAARYGRQHPGRRTATTMQPPQGISALTGHADEEAADSQWTATWLSAVRRRLSRSAPTGGLVHHVVTSARAASSRRSGSGAGRRFPGPVTTTRASLRVVNGQGREVAPPAGAASSATAAEHRRPADRPWPPAWPPARSGGCHQPADRARARSGGSRVLPPSGAPLRGT